MIERRLYKLIKAGLAQYLTDPALLTLMLTRNPFAMERSEAEAVAQILTLKPVNVIHGFPRADSKFPLVAIFLGSERERVPLLGNVVGNIDDLQDAPIEFLQRFGAHEVGAIWEHSFKVQACSVESPDHATYIYQILKFILTRARTQLTADNIMNVKFTGSDLGINKTEYLPEYIFRREFIISCDSLFSVPEDASYPIINEVDVHMADPIDTGIGVTVVGLGDAEG